MLYAPGNDPYVITVGAYNDNGHADPGHWGIAPFSSYGVTQDGFAKPDLVAPGTHVVSIAPPDAVLGQGQARATYGPDFLRMSGTSMAAPMVAGWSPWPCSYNQV